MSDLNLIDISAPQLDDPSYSSQLSTMFENINTNFKRLISTPVIKGNQGDSIGVRLHTFVSSVGGDRVFDDIGEKIVRAIFDNIDLEYWDGTLSNLNTIIEEDSGVEDIKPISSSSGFIKVTNWFTEDTNCKISMYYNTKSGEDLYPAQLYFFFDNRVSVVSNAPTNSDNYSFRDYSCYIQGTPIDGDWSANRVSMFPTIEWSRNVDNYVWRVGGVLTNIIAKGVRGLRGIDGQGDRTYIVFVDDNISDKKYRVTSYIDASGVECPINSGEYEDLDTGRVVVALQSVGSGDSRIITNIFVGALLIETTTINNEENEVVSAINHSDWFRNVIVDNYNGISKAILDKIGSSEEAKGYYLPTNDNTNNYHMLWSDSSNSSLDLSIVSDKDNPSIPPQNNYNLQITYPTIFEHTIDVLGDSTFGGGLNVNSVLNVGANTTINASGVDTNKVIVFNGNKLVAALYSSGKMLLQAPDNNDPSIIYSGSTKELRIGAFESFKLGVMNNNGSWKIYQGHAVDPNIEMSENSTTIRYLTSLNNGIQKISKDDDNHVIITTQKISNNVFIIGINIIDDYAAASGFLNGSNDIANYIINHPQENGIFLNNIHASGKGEVVRIYMNNNILNYSISGINRDPGEIIGKQYLSKVIIDYH